MQGCFASRYTHISGRMHDQINAENAAEVEWIMSFKHNHEYRVLNGWKMWESNGSYYMSDGAEGAPFTLYIECADCDQPIVEGCTDCEEEIIERLIENPPGESSARMLFYTSSIVVLALFAF